MEFGKHIGKGLWAFADKSLPALYGIGFVFLVVRVLPEKEFGAYAVIQTTFAMVTAVGYAFALQPLTKFAAETEERGPYVVAGMALLMCLFIVVSVLVLVLAEPLADLFDPQRQANLTPLFHYLPLLLISAFYRNVAVSFLQAKYQVQKIFWIDAVYFLGVLVLVAWANRVGNFNTAADMIVINAIMLSCSTVVALLLTLREMSSKLRFRRDAFVSMWHFGKFMFAGNLIYVLYSQMDVLFVSSFAGVVAVATYNAAKVLTRLFDMVSQVLQLFLLPFASKTYAEQNMGKLTVTAEKSICFSTILLLPVFLAMLLFPQEILHLLYGGKYDSGAPIVRVVGFLAFIVPWNSVAANYIIGMGKVKDALYLSVVLLAVAVPAYAILTPRFGAIGTSVGLVVALLVATVLLVRLLQRLIPLKVLNVVRRIRDVWSFVHARLQ